MLLLVNVHVVVVIIVVVCVVVVFVCEMLFLYLLLFLFLEFGNMLFVLSLFCSIQLGNTKRENKCCVRHLCDDYHITIPKY